VSSPPESKLLDPEDGIGSEAERKERKRLKKLQ